MKNKKKIKPKYLILDVDGVFTDGKFHYTTEGKVMKKFGPDDNDGLALLKDRLYVHAVSGDKRGFGITKKRIADDMKLPLDLVSTFERLEWISERFNPEETIYMGDGILDPLVFKGVAYGIAPANSFYETKKMADFVTKSKGSEGAVAEACIHILKEFFDDEFDIHSWDFGRDLGVWRKGSK